VLLTVLIFELLLVCFIQAKCFLLKFFCGVPLVALLFCTVRILSKFLFSLIQMFQKWLKFLPIQQLFPTLFFPFPSHQGSPVQYQLRFQQVVQLGFKLVDLFLIFLLQQFEPKLTQLFYVKAHL
jgi:hypothetical protein